MNNLVLKNYENCFIICVAFRRKASSAWQIEKCEGWCNEKLHRLPETRGNIESCGNNTWMETLRVKLGSHTALNISWSVFLCFASIYTQNTGKIRSRGFDDKRNMKEKREEWNSARLWWIEWFSFQSSNCEREDENKKTEITNTCLLISNLINNVSTVELIEKPARFGSFPSLENLQDKAFRLRSSLSSTHSNVSVNFW